MNTIERIEARGCRWFTGAGEGAWMRVTADEWSAIKAACAALEIAQPYVDDAAGFPEQFKPGVVKKHSSMVRDALSKLEN